MNSFYKATKFDLLLLMSFPHLFLTFLALNVLFRLPFITELGFLNEDIALLSGATKSLKEHGILFPFYSSLGPTMLRPWQWLGLAAQWSVFGTTPLPYHLVSLLLLSISQALLGTVLVKKTALLPTIIGLSFLGFARAGGESNFWISNQHDQYLLLGSALCLIAVEKLREATSKSLLPLIFCGLSFFVGFLANEKGVVLPILAGLWLVQYLPLHTCSLRSIKNTPEWSILLKVLSVAVLCLGSYFAYRYMIFSTFIGGYEDKVLPEEFASISTILQKAFSLLLTPVLQYTPRVSLIIGAAFFLLLGIGLFFSSSKLSVRPLLIFSVALLVAALPTLRYLPPPPPIGVFSTRMFWLPLIVWSIGLVFSFHQIIGKSSSIQFRRVVLPLLLLSCTGFGGIHAANQSVEAHDTTLSLLQDMQRVCSCVDPKRPSVKNLPQHIRTVNSFTEPGWLEHYALATGTARCAPSETPCTLRYKKKATKLVEIVKEKAGALRQRNQTITEAH